MKHSDVGMIVENRSH